MPVLATRESIFHQSRRALRGHWKEQHALENELFFSLVERKRNERGRFAFPTNINFNDRSWFFQILRNRRHRQRLLQRWRERSGSHDTDFFAIEVNLGALASDPLPFQLQSHSVRQIWLLRNFLKGHLPEEIRLIELHCET